MSVIKHSCFTILHRSIGQFIPHHSYKYLVQISSSNTMYTATEPCKSFKHTEIC